MTTNAFVGGIKLWREKPGSPGEYTAICQVTDISGLGQTNPLLDATTFCSTAREYIGGLPDGTEMTLTLNFERDATVEFDMIRDVQAQATRGFRVTVEEGSPAIKFDFDGLCLSWTLNPSVSDINQIVFGLKISGDITIS